MKTRIESGKDCCRYCGQWVDLENEGNTHSDGSVSHEGCFDSAQFTKENLSDND